MAESLVKNSSLTWLSFISIKNILPINVENCGDFRGGLLAKSPLQLLYVIKRY